MGGGRPGAVFGTGTAGALLVAGVPAHLRVLDEAQPGRYIWVA
jgi:hypothetical protein